MQNDKMRHARMKIESAAWISHGSEAWSCVLEDISATGVLVRRPDGWHGKIGDRCQHGHACRRQPQYSRRCHRRADIQRPLSALPTIANSAGQGGSAMEPARRLCRYAGAVGTIDEERMPNSKIGVGVRPVSVQLARCSACLKLASCRNACANDTKLSDACAFLCEYNPRAQKQALTGNCFLDLSPDTRLNHQARRPYP